MGDPAGKARLFEQLARVGKALASGKRLELLDLLAQAERPVEALADAAGLGVTTTSAHLQTLKQAGLVATRREGTKVWYRLAGPDVVALYLQARQVADARLPDVDAARAAYLDGDPDAGEDDQDVEPVDRDELARRVAADEVTVVDVRPPLEYAAGHLPGAVNVPLEELPARLAELPAGREVVAYCRGPYCAFAHDAVRLLRRHGRTATRLTDGVAEWRLAGLPVEVASPPTGTGRATM